MKTFMTTIARKAGSMALEMQATVKADYKGEHDPVTEADKAIEHYLREQIKHAYPDHSICGEEQETHHSNSEIKWFIDPIDGTTNYKHGLPHFAISLAVTKEGNPIESVVYMPAFDRMYHAKLGQGATLNDKPIQVSATLEFDKSSVFIAMTPRKNKLEEGINTYREFSLHAERAREYGFCAGELAFIAGGAGQGLFKPLQHPWDFAAGMLLVIEAGGRVTDIIGNPIIIREKQQTIVASNGHIHQDILNTLKNRSFDDMEV